MAKSPIRAVILDFGGVLLQLGDPEPHEELAREIGIPVEQLRYEIFDGPLSLAAQRGEISPEELWRELARRWGLPEGKSGWLALRFWEGVRFDFVLINWLREIKSFYRTGLLSNAWSDLRTILTRLGIADAFDVMVISAEERLMKPDPAIYRLTLERLGVRPEEAVFVDDREENVQAARALGIHGIRYRSREQVFAELRTLGIPTPISKKANR